MFRRGSNRTKMKHCQSHGMSGVIREVFLVVISLLVLISAVFAEDASTTCISGTSATRLAISTKSDDKIEGYTIDVGKTKDTQKPGVRFSAVNGRSDEAIDINLIVNDKQINVRIGYGSKEGDFHIRAYDSNSPVAMLTEADNVLVNKALNVVARELRGSTLVEDKLVRTLNLMDSWPSNLPLNMLEYAQSFAESETTKAVSWCGISLPTPKSDSICDAFTDGSGKRDATYTKDGGNYCYIPFALYPQYITYFGMINFLSMKLQPPLNTETEEVSIGGDKCLGRCGKGCIGDGVPNREVNIYTQACLNHDVCVDNYGYKDARCNWMFVFAMPDFVAGPECQVSPLPSSPCGYIATTNSFNATFFKWWTNFPSAKFYTLTIDGNDGNDYVYKGRADVDSKTYCSTSIPLFNTDCQYEIKNLHIKLEEGTLYRWKIQPYYQNADSVYAPGAESWYLHFFFCEDGKRFSDTTMLCEYETSSITATSVAPNLTKFTTPTCVPNNTNCRNNVCTGMFCWDGCKYVRGIKCC
ncbi:MAG: hypothetical protein HQL05_13120 [Nitrospirae bacterium]|uniref:hypothetical protein n=1 Tax=Candidatus Magnetobacterium casense TaxID=1455061 RepID=UPI00058FB70D|nr:hypothetical protein [Candidatus Magnetobacterium casensis]MBF0338756.1 hypothetical protein [Nitrospirota bacterium]